MTRLRKRDAYTTENVTLPLMGNANSAWGWMWGCRIVHGSSVNCSTGVEEQVQWQQAFGRSPPTIGSPRAGGQANALAPTRRKLMSVIAIPNMSAPVMTWKIPPGNSTFLQCPGQVMRTQ